MEPANKYLSASDAIGAGVQPIKFKPFMDFCPKLCNPAAIFGVRRREALRLWDAKQLAASFPPDIGPNVELAKALLEAQDEFEAGLFLTRACELADQRRECLSEKRYALLTATRSLDDGHIELFVSAPHDYRDAQLNVDVVARRVAQAARCGIDLDVRRWMVEIAERRP